MFGVLPALLLLGAGGWRALAGPTPSETMQTLLGSGVALALLGNVMLFVAYDKPLTLTGLRLHDNQTRARMQFVQTLNPDTTMVVSYDSYKHFKLYAPQFQHNAWLDPLNGGRQVIPVPDGVTTVVFTDTPVFNLLQTLPADADYRASDTWAGRMAVRAGQRLVYQNGRLSLEG